LLVALNVVAAFAEAGALVVVARLALAIADGADDVAFAFGVELERGAAGALAFAALAVKLVTTATAAHVGARLSADTAVHAREAVLESYFGADWSLQSEERLGELQDFLVSSVNQLASVNNAYVTGISALANLVVIVGIAVMVSPIAAAACGLGAGVLVLVLRPMAAVTRRATQIQQAENRQLAAAVTESVRLTQEARAFGVRPAVRDRLAERVHRLHGPQQRQIFMQRLAPAVYQTAALTFLVLAVVVVGAVGGSDVASLGAAVVLLLRGLGYGQQLQNALQNLAASVPYLDALHERHQRYQAQREHPGTVRVERAVPVRFEGVAFEYRPDVRVLDRVTLTIEPREAIGIVGPSGSGKSTLLQLLLRLRPPTAGTITADGIDIWEIAADDWSRRVAFVPQEARMLHATVAENIAFFRDVDHAEIVAAAKLAHIHDDVMSWPDGYDTHVGEAGGRISGGQRQRVAIARALVTRPDLLVLDEPTSALDLRSEARLQETLRDLKGETALAIVAHRMSTVTLCDRILVLRNGQVEGFDRHAVLVETSPFYRDALRLSAIDGADAAAVPHPEIDLTGVDAR
jgi:ABC-type multidrug transport system fused ATPase/permease subunit